MKVHIEKMRAMKTNKWRILCLKISGFLSWSSLEIICHLHKEIIFNRVTTMKQKLTVFQKVPVLLQTLLFLDYITSTVDLWQLKKSDLGRRRIGTRSLSPRSSKCHRLIMTVVLSHNCFTWTHPKKMCFMFQKINSSRKKI